MISFLNLIIFLVIISKIECQTSDDESNEIFNKYLKRKGFRF